MKNAETYWCGECSAPFINAWPTGKVRSSTESVGSTSWLLWAGSVMTVERQLGGTAMWQDERRTRRADNDMRTYSDDERSRNSSPHRVRRLALRLPHQHRHHQWTITGHCQSVLCILKYGNINRRGLQQWEAQYAILEKTPQLGDGVQAAVKANR